MESGVKYLCIVNNDNIAAMEKPGEITYVMMLNSSGHAIKEHEFCVFAGLRR